MKQNHDDPESSNPTSQTDGLSKILPEDESMPTIVQTTLPLGSNELQNEDSIAISLLAVRPADRFEIKEFVGRGSMGEVYRAFDPTLNRTVALKFLLYDSVTLPQRFLREAQIQARIDHPCICKVYEIGILQNKPYIAMDFIDGVPLGEAANQMTLEEKIKVIQKVAEAIHVPHKLGLIHRDIKPGNILLQRTADGTWQPYITDFGIAFEYDSPTITKTGVFLGTPPYMAPEQTTANPELITPKTDIYALGCTLYELIAGVRPFDGKSTAEILMKIVNEDAIPLRQRIPSIPADLETIVLKCMEKDPARRYDSARTLAEDLRRYLDGEPILAHRAGFAYRLLKKTKKHKAASIVIASSVLLCLIGFIFGMYTWWSSDKRARIAHQFGQEITELENFIRYAYALPLHDTRTDMKVVRDRMKAIEQGMKESGWLAIAPGKYALGRAYFVLQDYETAKSDLEAAWRGGYQEPEVAYALGLVMGSLYQQGLERAQNTSNKELREALKKEVEKKYKLKALEYLRASKGVKLEAPAYLESLIAFYDEKYSEALQKSDEAYRQAPWLYESTKLKATILTAMANEKKAQGQYQEANSLFHRSLQAYDSAAEIARSDSSLYTDKCAIWVWLMEIGISQGGKPEKEHSEALRSCDLAMVANPDNATAYLRQSGSHMRWAQFQAMRGADPQTSLNEAIRIAELAVEIAPQKAEFYLNRGTAYFMKGYFYEMRHGVNPIPSLERSIQDSQKSAQLSPVYVAFSNLGNAYAVRGDYEITIGKDPRESIRLAADSYRKALEFQPGLFVIHQNLGSTLSRKAKYELNHGFDCTESVNLSIQNFQKAIQANPNDSTVHSNLGTVQQLKGDFQKTQGIDPIEMYAEALKSLEKSIQVNPSNVYAYNNICTVYVSRSKFEFLVQKNLENSLKGLIDCCEKAIELNPKFALAYNNLADGYRLLAESKVQLGRNPEREIRRGKELLDQSLKLNPKFYETYCIRGEFEITSARWVLKNHKSPEAAFANATYWLNESLKYNVDNVDSYVALAELYRDKAKWQLNKGDRDKIIETGINMAQKAYSLNRFVAEALVIQAELQMILSQINTGEERIALSKMAKTNLEKAFQQNAFLKQRHGSLLDHYR